ncbi:MAG TPA: chemotaxis-specific protein-glutamate methyltransferase CheB [Actinomycetota bacterium]|nr:chemotaxis-specific protein-glutamate methyltransferase CheB [Actinomycetota bacterium]
MRPRVLVVDDSVVVRRLVSKALDAEGSVEVAGVAADGRIALQQIERLTPDAVILDLQMPVMDGLTALDAIRDRWPTLPVIIFSTQTVQGAEITLDALARGANDYVLKPSEVLGPTEAMARITEALVPRILAFCTARARRPQIPAPARAAVAPGRIDAVAIAVSTGGPTALARVIPALPADLPVPILVVQHMPPMFTRILAERLDRGSELRVVEAAEGQAVQPGGVWIAPGDHHMTVERAGAAVRIRTNTGPRENSCRPSADPLFRSVAAAYGANALAVVMTGMGSDGLRGAEELVAAGAHVLAQDEASSVVWGMPGFVVGAGLADATVPLEELAEEISRRAQIGRARTVAGAMS